MWVCLNHHQIQSLCPFNTASYINRGHFSKRMISYKRSKFFLNRSPFDSYCSPWKLWGSYKSCPPLHKRQKNMVELSYIHVYCSVTYHKNFKYLGRQVWTYKVDPNQTAPPTGAVWSGPALFAIQSASFGFITALKNQTGPFSIFRTVM